MVISGGYVLEVNTCEAARFNCDFDGDSVTASGIHSVQGKYDFRYASIKNNIIFEHKNKIISEPEHEAIYALYKLTLKGNKEFYKDENYIELNFNDIHDDFVVDIDYIIKKPNYPVTVNGITLPYNFMVMNKAALYSSTQQKEFNKDTIIFDKNEVIPKGKLQKYLKRILKLVGENRFHDYFHNFNKFLLECSTIIEYANPSYDSKHFVVKDKQIDDYKKTLVCEPYIGFHQNDIMFTDIVKPLVDTEHNILGDVFESGARIKSVQLLKAASNNGIPTDIDGKAYFLNIKQSLLDGLPKYIFFKSSDSARLALAQRQSAIPKGGELQRKFYHETGFLMESKDKDCGTTNYFKLTVNSKKHLESLNGRYLKDGRCINPDDESFESLIHEEIEIRSPIYCKSERFEVCKKCLGEKRPSSVNLGAAVGSYIPEAIIQSVLRTHHFSGAFITEINKEIVNCIKNLRFEGPNLIYTTPETEEYKDKLLEILRNRFYYNDPNGEKINFVKKDTNVYEIEVYELPFNDDSVKQLHNIISYIDRNRNEEDGLITIEEMYQFLCENIVFPNGIYSLLIELIISILYYYDNTPLRYAGKYNRQIALGKIIETLDPKLSIFYNFNKTAISKIYQNNGKFELQHMNYELLDMLE